MIPEKIMFSTTNHQLIKNAADNNGVSIHTYIHDRAISMEYSHQHCLQVILTTVTNNVRRADEKAAKTKAVNIYTH